MFTIYDVEVFPNDWMIVFLNMETGEIERIHNDRERLITALSHKEAQILVGYNNYRYDDLILAGLLKGVDPYELTKRIFANQRISLRLNLVTLDVMQEIRQGLSLKEAIANLGLDIHETPVDFEKEQLTPEEIERIFTYCENDVKVTAELFKQREPYFASKFELVQTFKLQPTDLKKTRANMAASILKANKQQKLPEDRLNLTFDERIKKTELPQDLLQFYQEITSFFQDGISPDDLEKKSLVLKIAGLDHTIGFGGLHAAQENYVGEGNYLQIDVASFYPSLMINNHFISRASTQPDFYKKIYDERLKLKAKKDPKEEVFKIVLNATFGASKSIYNPLFDPLQFNNTVANGQLIMVHLILLLKPFIELIQTNTDAILVRYDEEMLPMILGVLKHFETQYHLKFDIDKITKVAQRDVNNYCVQYEDGTIKAKGFMANHTSGDWERNSLSITDQALVNYYMHGTPVQTTVIDTWKRNELLPFQLIAKTGKFDGMVHERLVKGAVIEQIGTVKLQNVNRIFATKNKKFGTVYKVRDGKHHKVANCPDSALVWNGAVSDLDKRLIDLNWYVKRINEQIF